MSHLGNLAVMPRTRRGLVLFWTAIMVMTLVLQSVAAVAPRGALATGQKVTLCHATNSETNPYRVITVDIAAAGLHNSGHDGHDGPIWYPGAKAAGVRWGDIIPPYTYQPKKGPLFVYPGKNWPEGEAYLRAGCKAPAPAAAPGFTVDKQVSLSANGPWQASLTTTTGTTLYYRITITNTGNVALHGVTLSDNTFNLTAKGCTIPTTLAVGAHYDCNYSSVAVTGTTTNIATGDTNETVSDTGTATATAHPATGNASDLTIDKSNNAPLVNVGGTNLPTASEGSTVTFTLTYTHTGSASHDGTITDVLPVGLTYVAGSATDSADFSFDGYNAGTRTLTWTADEGVSASGSVSYMATVDASAAGIPQPLKNLATIDSGGTEPDTDISDVYVPVPPLGETDNPGVPTAPATDVLSSGGTAAPGMNLGIVLALLVIVTLVVVFATPIPSALRGRNRRR